MCQSNDKTSPPVIWTGVIPTFRSPSLPAVASLSHGPQLSSQFITPGSMAVQCITNCSLFGHGGLMPGPKFTNLAEACSTCLSAILQNFSPITQTVYEMCITKDFHLLTLAG